MSQKGKDQKKNRILKERMDFSLDPNPLVGPLKADKLPSDSSTDGKKTTAKPQSSGGSDKESSSGNKK